MTLPKIESLTAITLAGGLAACLAPAASRAGEFGLGVAAGAQTSMYRDLDDQSFVIPVIDYQGERFSFFLDTASFLLTAGETSESEWRVRAIATARIFDQPKRRADLDERHSTAEVGLESGMRGSWGSVNLQVTTDALDNHNGYEAELGYAYEIRATERLTFTPGIEVSYYSEKLANYYFGVRPGEARTDRVAYEPGASGAASISLTTTYGLSDRWVMVGVVEVMKLGDELADSPLIENDTSTTAVLGVMYRF